MIQLPICSPLVLCEGVYQEPQSRKLTLLGVFNEFAGEAFPLRMSCFVYAALAEGLGECRLAVRLSDFAGEDRTEIAASRTAFPDPLACVEAVYQIEPEFSAPGVYYLELAADGEVVASRRVVVRGCGC